MARTVPRRSFIAMLVAGFAALFVGFAWKNRIHNQPTLGSGVSELGVGLQGNNIATQLAAFETLIGRGVNATRHYQNWPDTIVDSDVVKSVAAGRSPLMVWHPFYADGTGVRWADISAGKYDTDITRVANELKTLGSAPARFVFHHEPEDDVDAIGAQGKCGIGPSEFVAAWRRVRNRLRNAGVPLNVQIGICLMGGTFRGGHGGPAVWIPSTLTTPDFIACDGYTRDPGSGQKWKTFVDTFGAAHDFAVARGKPFVIEECGAAEVTTDPTLKPAWFDEAALTLNTWQPSLFMYSNVNASNFGGQDYRVNTSTESLTAFQALANSAPFV